MLKAVYLPEIQEDPQVVYKRRFKSEAEGGRKV